MQRRIQPAVVQGSDESRRLRENDPDEPLHIRRTARKQLTVALYGLKRIRVPVLTVHRHDVGMSGENQTGLLRVAQGREQIRLLAGGVESQAGERAETLQVIANPFDQSQI